MDLSTIREHDEVRQFIRSILERTRSRDVTIPVDGRNYRSKFDMREFKQLSLPAMHEYAAAHLDVLGAGSSRSVYLLSSKKVLKIAGGEDNEGDLDLDFGSEAGIGQNEAELEIASDGRCDAIIARIFDHDGLDMDGCRWLISELVRPATKEEIDAYLNVSHRDYSIEVKHPRGDVSQHGALSLARNFEKGNEDKFYERSTVMKLESNDTFMSFVEMLHVLFHEHQLEPGDVCAVGHWGWTPSRRLVLLDYGFTSSVRNEFY